VGAGGEKTWGHYDKFLALKVRGHSSKLKNIKILHIDHVCVQAQHIEPDKITGSVAKF